MSSVHCSNTGTRVSAIVEQEEQKHPLLLLWFVDSDAVKTFTPKLLTKSRSKDQPSPSATSSPLTFPPDLPTNSLQQQQQLAAELVGREPLSQHWDAKEHKMLVVEWSGLSTSSSPEKAAPLVSVLFVTPEKNVVISEIVPHNSSVNKFIGIKAPFLYYSKKGTVAPLFSTENLRNIEGSHSDVNPPGSIGQVTLRDFVGLEESNTDIINAMMDFSYYVAIGNMDEAFKAIRLVKSRAVWESMARVCVKTERLDVALICLGYMGNARAARAVRESKKVPEPEVRLAVLAVELGMLDEAEKLYRKSKRYDLLNQFYQYSGQWKKAIEVAETRDRMHLKTTYYNYARHAEELGELNAAINSYEKSNTHRFEVPRMLLDDPAALEGYVMKSKDKEVRKWWAEYLESCGEWEQAMQFYETAKDYYSLVRILCFNGQLARAAEVTEESGSKAAAYHLARRLAVENADPKRAIYFFTKAQCYSPAIQLAKENGLDHELMNLALLSKQEDMLDAAKYYEENSETIDKAILLFHKAGEVSHALDLCFQHHHYDVLDVISEDLHEGSSQETTQRVADYYMEKGLFDKAMEILVRTRRTEEAMKLCVQHSVPLTEELVERISIQKGDSETAEEAKHRVEVLEQLADCCLTMGSYHLAAKKYTQAGNRTKAMKALLKSGDTEKIVFFAGVSRQKDIYVMAANYLQTLDWRNDHSIMKNIISFYTKGKALDSLAGFYDACAQVEIDEFQNYSKAAGALDEAIKVLGKVKAKNPVALAAKIDFFKERVELVKKFAEAKSLYQDNPAQCVEMCQGLLDEPRLDAAVRAGDVYGLMIEHYASAGNFEQAYALMKEMRQRIPNVNLSYYIDIRVIENIHTAMGIPLGRGMGPEGREGEKVGVQRGGEEELEEEEVESDMDD